MTSAAEPRSPAAGYTPLLALDEAPARSRHAPLEGCEAVELFEHAYGKHTFQSSTSTDYSGWMFATEAESEPWWEIDLGEPVFVERMTLWLAPCPEDAEVTVRAHVFHTPGGGVPRTCFRAAMQAGALPVASDGSSVFQIAADCVARYVRVSLRREGGAKVALLLRSAAILGARVFGDTLLASYQRAFTLFGERPLFSAREVAGAGPFVVTHRYCDVWRAARALAAGLATEIDPGAGEERVLVGLCTRNRPEWVMMDVAALLLGHVVVPLSPDDSDERLAGILERCPLRAVLVEGSGRERFVRLAARCPSLRLVVSCDSGPLGDERSSSEGPVLADFADLVSRGAALPAPEVKARDPRDLYTLLFTSGSTGAPKGAMRSYATFLAMLKSYFIAQPAVHLSFQPLSHLTERLYQPAVLLGGGLIGFSSGGAHLLSDLRALQPSVVGSVPRLFEVVHTSYLRRLEAALAAAPDEPKAEVEARVLAESRAVFGERVQAIAVGSAPCSPEVLAFLRRCFADLWVADGYGSTECGTITSDGRIQPHVEVKLVPVAGLADGEAERGEIWVRTPHMIDGYYGDPAATAASIDAGGFFATGDLGERTASGGVRVVGRVKNVIKLGQGEFVAIDRIEAVLADCPLVDQMFVAPDASSSGLVAVVVPQAGPLGEALGAPARSSRELAAHPEATRVIVRALSEQGRRAGLASFELPRAVLVEPEPFTVASGLLTASGKLARTVAAARYAARIAEIGKAIPPVTVTAEGSLPAQIAGVVSGVLGRRVEPADLLHEGLGIDSLAAAEVLAALSAALGREIPLRTWLEARTIEALARELDAGILGRSMAVRDLRERDAEIEPKPRGGAAAEARAPFETVLLTGATGLLGAHLLESIAARTGAHVVCLVRASSDDAAALRVRQALSRHAIEPPDPARWTAVAADLAAPLLGLAEARFDELAERCDVIVHGGAEVNWLAPYEALRAPNVLGTVELLGLAMSARRKPFHFVSTISTAPADGDETTALSFAQARTGGGYGLSKWMAERIVRRAAERGHPAAVYRPAMITGHSRRGRGNPDDYVHRYLRACIESGRHLDAAGERLDMTPVDFVADAITALLVSRPDGGEVHHLVNLDQSMTYTELGRAMAAAGHPCSPVRYADFRTTVVNAPTSALRPLASYFPEAGFALHMGPWPAARTRATLAALGVVCPPVDEALIARYLAGLSAPTGELR